MSRVDNSTSDLKLDKLYFKHIEFLRSKNDIDLKSLNIGITPSFEILEHNNIQVTLILKMYSDDKTTNMLLELIGDFALIGDHPEEFTKEILTENTIAIMFPYLRSQLTLLTSQPEMQPIILPPMNIIKMLAN